MPHGRRKTRIFGTLGEIYSDEITIEHFDFRTDQKRIIAVDTQETALAGHGGGDFGLMEAIVSAIATNDPDKILSGPQESLETHLMVFAAEEAQHESRVVEVVI